MVTLTAGRRVADSDKEQVQIGLDEFNRNFGAHILKALSGLLLQDSPFTLRLQIHGQDRRVSDVHLQADWTISLDPTRPD